MVAALDRGGGGNPGVTSMLGSRAGHIQDWYIAVFHASFATHWLYGLGRITCCSQISDASAGEGIRLNAQI